MAAALVLRGAINADLFLEGGISGEMVFVYAKVQPFLKEIREKMQMPSMFANIEKVIMQNKAGKERLKMISARIEARRKESELAEQERPREGEPDVGGGGGLGCADSAHVAGRHRAHD